MLAQDGIGFIGAGRLATGLAWALAKRGRTIDAVTSRAAQIGGFHPLQSFGDPDVTVKTLPGCAIAIEADEPLRACLEELAAVVGCRPIRLPAGSRAWYHAAHYAARFVFALINEAAEIWQTFGVTREETVAALAPLLHGTAASMEYSGVV